MKNKIKTAIVAAAVILSVGLVSVADASTYACSTTAQYGQCFSGNPVVENNVWGMNGAYNGQSLSAFSPLKWDVTSNVASGNHSVVSYPETVNQTHTNGGPTPLSSYASLGAQWHSALPVAKSNDSYESAFDLWMGGNYADPNHQEVMVWTHTLSTSPAGSYTGVNWTDPTTGTTYRVWSGSGNQIVSFVGPNIDTGRVDLLDLLKFTTAKFNFHGDNALDNEDYGFEVLSTSGTAATFHVYGLRWTHAKI